MAANLDILINATDHASGVFRRIDDSASGLSRTMGTALKGAAIAGAAGIGIATVAGVNFIKAAAEEEAGIRRLAAAVDAAGGSWAAQGQAIEGVIQQRQKLAFSDDELRSSLALLTAITGDSDEALRRQAVAMDFARGANIDLGTASKLLGKVTDETVNVLGRYGIRVKDGADATDVLALVQQKFAGQSSAFAESTAGKWARFNNQVSNIKETIGGALLPVVTVLADRLATFLERHEQDIQGIVQGWSRFASSQVLPAIGDAIGKIAGAVGPIVTKLVQLVRAFAQNEMAVKGAAAAVVAFVAALAAFQIGSFVTGIASAVAGLIAHTAATTGATGATALFTAALTAAKAALVTTGIGALVLGIVVALVVFEKKTQFFSKQLLPALSKAFGEVADVAGPVLGDALTTLRQGWDNLRPAVEAVASFIDTNLKPSFDAVGGFLREHPALIAVLAGAIVLLVAPWLAVVAAVVLVLAKWDEIKAMLTVTIPQAIDAMIRKVEGVPVIGEIFRATLDYIQLIVATAFGAIRDRVEFMLNSIRAIIEIVTALIRGDWAAAWDGIKNLLSGFLELMRADAERVFGLIRGIVSIFVTAVSGTLRDLVGVVISLFSPIGDIIAFPFRQARNAVQWLIDKIRELINLIPDIPSMPDLSPGVNFPDISPFAKGVRNFRGGLALVGEEGPELVQMPHGTNVFTAAQTRGLIGAVVTNHFHYSPTLSTASSAEQRRLELWVKSLLRR
jgi:phage-related protein